MPSGNCKTLERFPDAYRHSQIYTAVLIRMVQQKSSFTQVSPVCVCVCARVRACVCVCVYIYIWSTVQYMHRQGYPAEIQTPTQ